MLLDDHTYETLVDDFLAAEVDKRDLQYNEQKLWPTICLFVDKLYYGDIVTDKSGVKIVETLGWQCRNLNPWQPILDFAGKKTSVDYCRKELLWYLSQDLSVKDIGQTAKIWQQVCSTKGEVNSNYGWCIFSKDNFSQYNNVLTELIRHQDSRRATMIFTRPSMWEDYNKDGMSDFICTWGTHIFIRDKKLYYIVNQRSCDFWFGFRNDFVFHSFVYQLLFNDLKNAGVELEQSKDGIIYNCDTIHLYERHFKLIQTIHFNRGGSR